MFNSAEHKICPANKSQIANNCKCFRWSLKISLLINMKLSTIVDIFIFISRENFMLSWVGYEKTLLNYNLWAGNWTELNYTELNNYTSNRENHVEMCCFASI